MNAAAPSSTILGPGRKWNISVIETPATETTPPISAEATTYSRMLDGPVSGDRSRNHGKRAHDEYTDELDSERDDHGEDSEQRQLVPPAQSAHLREIGRDDQKREAPRKQAKARGRQCAGSDKKRDEHQAWKSGKSAKEIS